MNRSTSDNGDSDETVAKSILHTLADSGVDYIFSNFGTDHTPIIEAAAQLREAGRNDSFPEFVPCPHEYVALSAAHGYAVASGDPQAVLVHVDVGTQNLGAAMHNAHRANVPVFIMSGIAPVSDDDDVGGRDNPIHYYQDVFDQTNIVAEYCRWTKEYQPPADPAETVRRGLERSLASPQGPVYLSFGREAFEAPTPELSGDIGPVRRTRPVGAGVGMVDEVADRIEHADRPLIITSNAPGPLGEWNIDALVSFAEEVGVGVVEHTPSVLCFPRDHDLHVGFDPTDAIQETDLLILLETDVPWVPSQNDIPDDLDVVQIDTNPTKSTYQDWPFAIDVTVMADPATMLRRLTERVDTDTDTSVWKTMHHKRCRAAERRAVESRDSGRLDATVLSDEISSYVNEKTIIMEGAVTNRSAALHQIPLSEPGSYFWRGGAGLGWSVPAGIGTKLATPDSRVISLIGDGGYLFSNPAACALTAENADAPTLSVIYHNDGWEAVRKATRKQHGSGASVASGVPEGNYGQRADLSKIATISDTYARRIDDFDALGEILAEAVVAVDEGQDVVLDVQIEE